MSVVQLVPPSSCPSIETRHPSRSRVQEKRCSPQVLRLSIFWDPTPREVRLVFSVVPVSVKPSLSWSLSTMSPYAENLPLRVSGNSIPLLFGRKIDRWVHIPGKSLLPWEVVVGLNAVTNESSHGNTAVFDLRLTE